MCCISSSCSRLCCRILQHFFVMAERQRDLDLVAMHNDAGYESDEERARVKKARRTVDNIREAAAPPASDPFRHCHSRSYFRPFYDKTSRLPRGGTGFSSAHEAHRYMMDNYVLSASSQPKSVKTDYDVLKEHHKFIHDDESMNADDWEQQFALRYYKKLYKEYALADLSMYDKGLLGLRWRTKQEVISGKGQFMCGCLQCNVGTGDGDELQTLEVPFEYIEDKQQKTTLVTLRLCEGCAAKLKAVREKQKHRQSSGNH